MFCYFYVVLIPIVILEALKHIQINNVTSAKF
jgi:hypothetical protein